MADTDATGTALTIIGRLMGAAFYVLPALFGIFMILWGVFPGEGDMTLIIVGLLIFLMFGYGTCRALTGKED
jgi:hypothetical protein